MLKNWIKSDNDTSNKLVLSSRIRLARNIDKKLFSNKLTDDEAEEITNEVERCLENSDVKFKKINLKNISNVDKNCYLEKHLISKDLIKLESKSAFFLNEDETISIMTNEEDHLRLQFFNAGYNLIDTYNEATKLDNLLEKYIDYSFSEKFGYITACPTNLGTAMRSSVMIHLPALTFTDYINKVYKALTQVGMTIRGLYGEGSKSEGNIYQISNQVTLGISEQDILNNLYAIVKELTDREFIARETLSNDYGFNIKDKVSRSIGILSRAYVISSKEALELLSNVRLGVEEGIVDMNYMDLNKVLIECQPATLQSKFDGKELAIKDRDVERAKLIRKYFNDVEINY